MKKREAYDVALRALDTGSWRGYRGEHSGLPGPRANLELLSAAAERAPAWLIDSLVADSDEYLRSVGTVGLGRLLAEAATQAEPGEHPIVAVPNENADERSEGAELLSRLRVLAMDSSWRVREAVAMALQRVGDTSLSELRYVVRAWSLDEHPLVQRAAVAGICEPRLVTDQETAEAAVHACLVATLDLAKRPAEGRRSDEVRALRKGLAYCWSVAIAAAPAAGLPQFRSLDCEDADVAWIVKQNLTKARLQRVLAAEAASESATSIGNARRSKPVHP